MNNLNDIKSFASVTNYQTFVHCSVINERCVSISPCNVSKTEHTNYMPGLKYKLGLKYKPKGLIAIVLIEARGFHIRIYGKLIV